MTSLPRYDWHQTYQWNYDHAPDPPCVDEPPLAGDWTFCGRPVASPLGIAAGPLLNGRWCLYYAALGFDVVTYKTVRSDFRACYPLPNLQPVECGSLDGGEANLAASNDFYGSWAVSFGMPSQAPEVWRADIAETRRRLPSHKLLNVSVVGTMQSGWSIEQLADDYAMCAGAAAESGADSLEFNLSCPNVNTCDGQLYQKPSDASLVAERVRQFIGLRPLVAKIGHFRHPRDIGSLLEAIAPHVDAVATTNCVAARVVNREGTACFDGGPRGIAGTAIFDASLRQTEAISQYATKHHLPIRVIGVGGISTIQHVRQYLNAGAEAVHLATAAMQNPNVGLSIRCESFDVN